jgi:hypothetical protein
MKILDFFIFLWVIFALLDPDPATQINADPCGSGYGSGSESETLYTASDSMHPALRSLFFKKNDREVRKETRFNTCHQKDSFVSRYHTLQLWT